MAWSRYLHWSRVYRKSTHFRELLEFMTSHRPRVSITNTQWTGLKQSLAITRQQQQQDRSNRRHDRPLKWIWYTMELRMLISNSRSCYMLPYGDVCHCILKHDLRNITLQSHRNHWEFYALFTFYCWAIVWVKVDK